MIVGVADGLTVAEVAPWAASARKHYTGRTVLLAQVPEDYLPLQEFGVELRNATLRENSRDKVAIFKLRWAALADFLYRETQANERVLFTDTRDVVFQRPPFHEGMGLYVATEGRTFATCQWNGDRMRQWFPREWDRVKDWPTYCAGVVQAPVSTMRDFAQAVRRRIDSRPGEADQAAFNLVAREMGAEAVPYTSAWTCHLAQMSPQSWCYAYGPRSELTPVLLMPVGEFMCLGKPFQIVHHWTYCKRLLWTPYGFEEKKA